MATVTVPSPDSVPASFAANRGGPRRTMSTHGMPKPPRTMSPERPYRFSSLSFPSPNLPTSPRTPGPMSPPMSAKSFGTFIDSEPLTPAYSPRMDHDWDNSTLVLLRPMSSSSEPSSPTEPAWDMMAPIMIRPQYPTTTAHPKKPTITAKEIPAITSPLHRAPQPKTTRRPKEIQIVDTSQKANHLPISEVKGEEEIPKTKVEEAVSPGIAPLGKLASKMKLMLRRKNANDKKKPKKVREYQEVDRLEDVHWSEY